VDELLRTILQSQKLEPDKHALQEEHRPLPLKLTITLQGVISGGTSRLSWNSGVHYTGLTATSGRPYTHISTIQTQFLH